MSPIISCVSILLNTVKCHDLGWKICRRHKTLPENSVMLVKWRVVHSTYSEVLWPLFLFSILTWFFLVFNFFQHERPIKSLHLCCYHVDWNIFKNIYPLLQIFSRMRKFISELIASVFSDYYNIILLYIF